MRRNRNETSWLGLGIALFNDKAGAGNLSLTKAEGFAAYHVQLDYKHMLSAGLSGGYAVRSLDFNKLRFDGQWDGLRFDGALASNEPAGFSRTCFFDLGAGGNDAATRMFTTIFPGREGHTDAPGFKRLNAQVRCRIT